MSDFADATHQKLPALPLPSKSNRQIERDSKDALITLVLMDAKDLIDILGLRKHTANYKKVKS